MESANKDQCKDNRQKYQSQKWEGAGQLLRNQYFCHETCSYATAKGKTISLTAEAKKPKR